MSSDVIFSFVRQLMLLLGGVGVAHGWGTDATWQTAISGLLALASSGWSIYNAHQAAAAKK